ncbi:MULTISPECIES: hypothetical protein [Sphingobacterium]|uniref:hypothetical protein n=1 Tax=Sphingobacterium TaxID=28453 RepID=UPI001049AF1A|nr:MULTISPECIES: hypothetical protein [Sphingobacterium]MCW2259166.1 hypothetical protein [Sphingobacterium kitahiroshimense]
MKSRSAPEAEPIKWWNWLGINYLLMSHFLSEFCSGFNLKFCSSRQRIGQNTDALRSGIGLSLHIYL